MSRDTDSGRRDVTGAEQADPMKVAWRGIHLCRQGNWEKGLEHLAWVTEASVRSAELPGIFYSFLGHGVARFQRRYRDGLNLCKHAIKIQFYEPENYVNLAQTYLLMNDRRAAISTVRKGLKIDRDHVGLQRLRDELGIRRNPILGFLPRRNSLNHLLGKLRHLFAGKAT